MALLDIRNLAVTFETPDGAVDAVKGAVGKHRSYDDEQEQRQQDYCRSKRGLVAYETKQRVLPK